MSFIYRGFSIEAMMSFMAHNKNTSFFSLEYSKDEGKWDLIISNSKYGDFSSKGAMTTVLIKAFLTYIDDAMVERDRVKVAIYGMKNRTYEE